MNKFVKIILELAIKHFLIIKVIKDLLENNLLLKHWFISMVFNINVILLRIVLVNFVTTRRLHF